MLKDPNVWVGDTGATCDITFDDTGMFNVRESKNTEGIFGIFGSGQKADKIGDIKGSKCDKHGIDTFPDLDQTIKGLKYSPKASFNLFSIGKRLKQGWKLGGDGKSIWITKGHNKIVFDGTVYYTRRIAVLHVLQARY